MRKHIIPDHFLSHFVQNFMAHTSIKGGCDVMIAHIGKMLSRSMEGGLRPHARVVCP